MDTVRTPPQRTDAPQFDKAPVTQYLAPLVNAEIKGRATASDLQVLRRRENLVPWLLVLRTMMHDVERTIANSRADIEHLRPTDGAQPTSEYRVAKADADRRNKARRRFLDGVQDKRDEVAMILSSEGMSKHTVGSVIDRLVDIDSVIAAGDLTAARKFVASVIDSLEAGCTT